mmetsp:Transcript_28453/g.72397  ORF Transcript_28453/g.72397 Transcript_28453/m.72397 type:complete len:219 (-) Transcript_28453:739-1395(-)
MLALTSGPQALYTTTNPSSCTSSSPLSTPASCCAANGDTTLRASTRSCVACAKNMRATRVSSPPAVALASAGALPAAAGAAPGGAKPCWASSLPSPGRRGPMTCPGDAMVLVKGRAGKGWGAGAAWAGAAASAGASAGTSAGVEGCGVSSDHSASARSSASASSWCRWRASAWSMRKPRLMQVGAALTGPGGSTLTARSVACVGEVVMSTSPDSSASA